LIAAASLALLLEGAHRPRYGGELHLELRDADALSGEIFETLVRFDERGEPQPCLAASWAHDASKHRWVFTPRANVTLHNGAQWAPGPINISDDKPVEQILREMANPKNAVKVNGAGTGPFRIVRSDPGKSARLEAHESYWRGRPYLDAVEVRIGRSPQEQALDLETGLADVIEVLPASVRRMRQRGVNVKTSQPAVILQLEFLNEKISRSTREALSLAIDRASIHRVLLDRQGEPSGALLPQWLTGYAFLFPGTRDLARAKALPHNPLSLAYDDPSLMPIADRIAVNAIEAGIALRIVAGNADVRLAAVPLRFEDAPSFEAERAILEDYRVIPLCHLPLAHAIAPHVRGWDAKPGQPLPLEDTWLDAR
jgi:MarR-like DNA-binding transcriptional regulator SgrR of sgrS sRNA